MSRRSWLYDVALALAVTVIDLVASQSESEPTQAGWKAQLAGHQHPGGFYAFVVIEGLVLIWRRRSPLAVLAIAVTADTAYAGGGYVDGAAFCAVLVALYTVGVTRPWRVSAAAGAMTLAPTWIAAGLAGPFGWLGGPNSVRWATTAAAVAIGLFVGNLQQLERAKSERDVQRWEDETRRRVDAERLRIARELHDVVAHSMSMINVQAGVAAHVLLEQPDQAASALQAIKEASREGLRELRSILNVLRQADELEGVEPAPGLASLDSLVSVARRSGLDVEVSTEGTPRPLPPTVDLAAYRIVQESLTNVLRHSGAESATVELRYEPLDMVVSVADDGTSIGTDLSHGAGAGISGMCERAEALGGTVQAGPRPEGGWLVTARLPANTVRATIT